MGAETTSKKCKSRNRPRYRDGQNIKQRGRKKNWGRCYAKTKMLYAGLGCFWKDVEKSKVAS